MNRSTFFRKLFGATVVAAVAPGEVLAAAGKVAEPVIPAVATGGRVMKSYVSAIQLLDKREILLSINDKNLNYTEELQKIMKYDHTTRKQSNH